MDSFEGKTAVITGGASGMGRAFADRFAKAGMHLVLADIEEPALNAAVEELRAGGTEVIGVVTDVADADSMQRMADAAFERFGTINILCNNAGVGGGGAMHELSAEDWRWILSVDLDGVIHGIRLFLGHMREHGDGHIINTASIAGLTCFGGMGPYNAAKAAVVSISETLYHELVDLPGLGVSVLCPGLVNTNILDSERNRPEQLHTPMIPDEPSEEELLGREFVREMFASATKPEAVAEMVYDAIVEDRFYIFTDDAYTEAIGRRASEIAEGRNPGPLGSLVD